MISVLLPTRNRVDPLLRMINSARGTANRQTHVEFVVYVDDDDELTEPALVDVGVTLIRGPRLVMSNYWNSLIPHAKGDLLMLGADDLVFRSQAWDEMLEQAFEDCPDKILYCHGDDLSGAGQYYGTHGVIHRKWYETVGYFTGPGFSADFADYWVTQIAEFIGRRKYLPYITEHRHHVFGKAEYDQTYKDTLMRLARDKTPKLYKQRLPERLRDAQKLIEVMQ